MKTINTILIRLALISMLCFCCQACSSGGSDNSDSDTQVPSAATATVVVETNKDEATFTITDADGTVWTGQGKSATFSDITVGNISAGFGYVDGYCTPSFENRAAGAGDTVKFTAEYQKGCDSNIIIETNHADASFLLIGPETYYGNGTYWEMLGVPDGIYTIIFNDLPGSCYNKPATQTRTAIAGSVLMLDEEYILDPGCSPDTLAWYKDADGDGFSNGAKLISATRPDATYYDYSELVTTSGDCNDNSAAIHPGATEVCSDGIDNNCDGLIDEGCSSSPIDSDSDGVTDDADTCPNTLTGESVDVNGCSYSSQYRFTDMGDGTVRDNNTSLIWLKRANAFGALDWFDALDQAAKLNSGEKGLTDGSVEGDWRLPSKVEWAALMSVEYTYPGPSLVNARGDNRWSEGDAFTEVQSSRYWSSTEYGDGYRAWAADMKYGSAETWTYSEQLCVWPMRSGN